MFEKMEISNKHSTVIYTFCMYCKRYLGAKNGQGIYGISHGVCKSCYRKVALAEGLPVNPKFQ